MHAVVKGPSAPVTGGRQNSSRKITSKFVVAKFQVCCMYHHPRGTHLHKRAGVRAGKSENDPYIYYKYIYIYIYIYIYTINFNSIEATEPAFNCFAAAETAQKA